VYRGRELDWFHAGEAVRESGQWPSVKAKVLCARFRASHYVVAHQRRGRCCQSGSSNGARMRIDGLVVVPRAVGRGGQEISAGRQSSQLPSTARSLPRASS